MKRGWIVTDSNLVYADELLPRWKHKTKAVKCRADRSRQRLDALRPAEEVEAEDSIEVFPCLDDSWPWIVCTPDEYEIHKSLYANKHIKPPKKAAKFADVQLKRIADALEGILGAIKEDAR